LPPELDPLSFPHEWIAMRGFSWRFSFLKHDRRFVLLVVALAVIATSAGAVELRPARVEPVSKERKTRPETAPSLKAKSNRPKEPLANKVPSSLPVSDPAVALASNPEPAKKEGEVEKFVDQVITLTFPTLDSKPTKPVPPDDEQPQLKGSRQEKPSADEECGQDESAEGEDEEHANDDEESDTGASDEEDPTDATGDITDDAKLPSSGKTEHVDNEPIPTPKNKEPGKLPLTPIFPEAVAPKAGEPTRPKIPADMLARRNRIRDVLAYHFERPEKAVDRTPWGLMHGMIGYGVDAAIVDAAGKKQNAIGYLCYNYAGKGQRLFKLDHGRIAADVGEGIQGHPGQFLAMLAQSRVELNYPMRVEGRQFRVQDLMEYEMRTCKPRTELTFKLMALSHYLPSDATWRDERGEMWSISRLIEEELKQPIFGAACGGNHRLNGLSYAVNNRLKHGKPLDGQFARADKFTRDYRDYLFTMQNPDGSFSTQWYRHRAAAPDLGRRVQTTGHMLEWLVYSCPDSQLQDPRLLRALDYLTSVMATGKGTKWEIGPQGHALHALAIYDERVFGGRPGMRAVQLSRENRAKQNAEKVR
jgi:hypothetical protein